MMNVMTKVLLDCIPEITMPFLDDIPMKGCAIEEKDETMDDRGCRKFVVDHIHDCEKVLRNLEDVHLTLSGKKSDIYVGPTTEDCHKQRSMRFKL